MGLEQTDFHVHVTKMTSPSEDSFIYALKPLMYHPWTNGAVKDVFFLQVIKKLHDGCTQYTFFLGLFAQMRT